MVGCQTVVRLVGVLRMNHHHEPEEGRISWRLTLKKRNLFGLVWRSIQRWRQPSDDEFRCATGAAVAPTYLLYTDLMPMHCKKRGGAVGILGWLRERVQPATSQQFPLAGEYELEGAWTGSKEARGAGLSNDQ